MRRLVDEREVARARRSDAPRGVERLLGHVHGGVGAQVDGRGEADRALVDHPHAHADLGVVDRRLQDAVAQAQQLGMDLLDAHARLGGAERLGPFQGGRAQGSDEFTVQRAGRVIHGSTLPRVGAWGPRGAVVHEWIDP